MQEEQGQMVNPEQLKALQCWLQETDTKLIQVNGQRKYGGPPEVWSGPVPGAHCEVFISQIPRDTFEDQLIPLFSSVGPLWEFRLMMNFSGFNRGFAYAKYGTAETALLAIRLLHGHTMKAGNQLFVCHSTEKRHLCIEGLPAAIKPKDLLKELRLVADGVETVALKTEANVEGVTGIVGFTSHYTASMAKRVVVEAFQKRFAMTVSIKWLSAERPYPIPQKPPRLSSSKELAALTASAPPPGVPPSSNAATFCRAPGGPVVRVHPHPHCCASSSSSSSPLRRQQAPTASPVEFLRRLCEKTGVGEPRYQLCYSHAEPDGFVCFSYVVRVPGIAGPFEGKVAVLPGPAVGIMVEEAQMLVACQILQKVQSYQHSH